MTRAELFDRLARMEIATTTVDHAPAFTVADLDGLAECLPGAHTKNLFLKDDKGALALVVAKSTTKVDLKQLAKRLGAGRFSFGSSDLMMTHLGVTPGRSRLSQSQTTHRAS